MLPLEKTTTCPTFDVTAIFGTTILVVVGEDCRRLVPISLDRVWIQAAVAFVPTKEPDAPATFAVGPASAATLATTIQRSFVGTVVVEDRTRQHVVDGEDVAVAFGVVAVEAFLARVP